MPAVGDGAGTPAVARGICGVDLAAAAAALAVAGRLGIEPGTTLDVLTGAAAASWILSDRGPRMLEADPVSNNSIDVFIKDLGLVLDSGNETRMPLPLAAAAQQLFPRRLGQRQRRRRRQPGDPRPPRDGGRRMTGNR